jgi:hypothetical protein
VTGLGVTVELVHHSSPVESAGVEVRLVTS